MRLQQYHINSYLDRTISQNENADGEFTVLFPNNSTEISMTNDEIAQNNKIYMKVLTLNLPNVLPNFKSSESTITFETDFSLNTMSGTIETMTIDYTKVYPSATELLVELNEKVAEIDVSFAFTYNDNTKKITFTNTSANKVRLVSSFRYDLTESITPVNDMMDRIGFSQSLVGLSGVVDGAGGTLVGGSVINLSRTSCYFLTLKQAQSTYNQSVVPSRSGRTDPVVAHIIAGSYGTYSQMTYVMPSYITAGDKLLNSLSFTLLDDQFEAITDYPESMPITMTIEFKIDV